MMMRIFFGLILIILTIMFFSIDRSGAEQRTQSATCNTRTKIVDGLAKRFGEAPVFLGLSPDGSRAFELLASQNGSWTMIMTNNAGVTCIILVGNSAFVAPLASNKPKL